MSHPSSMMCFGMKKHELHFHKQEDTEQARAFLNTHYFPPTEMGVTKNKISFTTPGIVTESVQRNIIKCVNAHRYAFNLDVEAPLPKDESDLLKDENGGSSGSSI